jgi:hypothetical protein
LFCVELYCRFTPLLRFNDDCVAAMPHFLDAVADIGVIRGKVRVAHDDTVDRSAQCRCSVCATSRHDWLIFRVVHNDSFFCHVYSCARRTAVRFSVVS